MPATEFNGTETAGGLGAPVSTPVGEAMPSGQAETLTNAAGSEDAVSQGAESLYRHRLPVRLGHWLNAVCLFILIMSGLQIFNAHPALYRGDRSDRNRAFFSIRGERADSGELRGVTKLAGHEFDTTGVLGISGGERRAFPSWATLPGSRWLAMGRQWHLLFAWIFVINGLIFWTYSIVSRHLTKDLLPTGRDWRGIGRDLLNHLCVRHPSGEEAKRYNALQKLAYTGVAFVLAPLIVLTGLTMSPAINAGFPALLDLFGGRQSARSIHFLACVAFVGFIVAHLTMVATTGLRNNLRSMVTGWSVIQREAQRHER
jgi:thiosulfate reductase cytochrome b subunit